MVVLAHLLHSVNLQILALYLHGGHVVVAVSGWWSITAGGGHLGSELGFLFWDEVGCLAHRQIIFVNEVGN